MQPGACDVRFADVADAPQRDDERVLDGVLSGRVIAEQRECRAEQSRLVALQQRAERGDLARLRAQYELAIARLQALRARQHAVRRRDQRARDRAISTLTRSW